MSVDEAQVILNSYNLQYVLIPVDAETQITDTFSAMVVTQYPQPDNPNGPHNIVKAGDIIDLKIK